MEYIHPASHLSDVSMLLYPLHLIAGMHLIVVVHTICPINKFSHSSDITGIAHLLFLQISVLLQPPLSPFCRQGN